MKGIEIKDISKRFKETVALEHNDLIFEEGRIYGLLGRNGAGKSTLLNIISNRLFADSGEILVDGVPAKENDEAQSKLYLMSERTLYPEKMKIKEIFKWSKEFYPDFDINYANHLADLFSLSLKKKPAGLSTGYTSILKIILALSANVPYVLLDEPVLGLDANHRDLFYRILIEKYSEKPFTAIISTHLIEEVSAIVEHIVIIKNGKVIRNESRDELLRGGYAVTGKASEVEQYCRGRKVIGTDVLGGMKTAYILGECLEAEVPAGLDIGMLDLQKLFVQLTNV